MSPAASYKVGQVRVLVSQATRVVISPVDLCYSITLVLLSTARPRLCSPERPSATHVIGWLNLLLDRCLRQRLGESRARLRPQLEFAERLTEKAHLGGPCTKHHTMPVRREKDEESFVSDSFVTSSTWRNFLGGGGRHVPPGQEEW